MHRASREGVEHRARRPPPSDGTAGGSWPGQPPGHEPLGGRSGGGVGVPRRWNDDEQPIRRRPVLLVAATAPWLVLAIAIGARAAATPPDAPPPSATDATPVPTTTAIARPSSPEQAEPDGDATDAPARSTGPDETPSLVGVSSLALVTARDHLGSAQPVTGHTGSGDRYVEHLIVEAVDHPAPGALVVTIAAVVLERQDGAFVGAELVRLAVPFVTGRGSARVAGTPYPVPGPDLEVTVPTGTEVTDPDLAVDAALALTAAGYRGIEVVTLSRLDSWPLVVEARAVAPGATAPARHVVWLRPHLGGFVVAGTSTGASTQPVEEATP